MWRQSQGQPKARAALRAPAPPPPPHGALQAPVPHLGLPSELVGLDEDGAYAYVFAHGPQRRLHRFTGPQDRHAGDLGARGRGALSWLDLPPPGLPRARPGLWPRWYLLPRVALAGVVPPLRGLHDAVLRTGGLGSLVSTTAATPTSLDSRATPAPAPGRAGRRARAR